MITRKHKDGFKRVARALRLKAESGRLPRPDGVTPMRYKNCQVCGAPAVNGVHSPSGEDNGIEWLCANHMDTTHPFDGSNFDN